MTKARPSWGTIGRRGDRGRSLWRDLLEVAAFVLAVALFLSAMLLLDLFLHVWFGRDQTRSTGAAPMETVGRQPATLIDAEPSPPAAGHQRWSRGAPGLASLTPGLTSLTQRRHTASPRGPFGTGVATRDIRRQTLTTLAWSLP